MTPHVMSATQSSSGPSAGKRLIQEARLARTRGALMYIPSQIYRIERP